MNKVTPKIWNEITFDEALKLLNTKNIKIWDYRYGFGVESVSDGTIGIAGWLDIIKIKEGAPEFIPAYGIDIQGYSKYKEEWTETFRAPFEYSVFNKLKGE